ncbi:DUF916 domain-containing protein [Enterococcus ratti]|nr:DUF916 domain-containing protein [Enterococcus ratti]
MYKINRYVMNVSLVLIIILTLFLFLLSSRIIFADEVTGENFGGFSIEGIPHSNQIDKNSSYFYLKENPNTTDEITIKLNNSSNQDKTLTIKVVDANTNSNGIVDYTGNLKNNKALKLPLTSIIKPKAKEVIVPKNSSVQTKLAIKMPAEKFAGNILGGVVVSNKKNDETLKEGTVASDYSYTIGIILTNEEKVELFKNVSVELEKVGPVLADGKKVVQADILNPNPYVFFKAEVAGAVYDASGSKKIKDNTMKDVTIAPYSAFPFQLNWQKKELKSGNYVFKGAVKTAENTWKFEKKFEIKNDEARKINTASVFKVFLPQWFKYSSASLSGIIAGGTIYIYIRLSKRRNKKNRERKS